MKRLQRHLIWTGLLFLLGWSSTVVLAQAIVEMAISIPPGFWAGIDSKNGGVLELSIANDPNTSGPGGGGGGGVFILVGTSSRFSQCERISDGQGVVNGTARIVNGILVSTDWTLTCRGEKDPILEDERAEFSLIRGFDQLHGSVGEETIVLNRLSNRLKLPRSQGQGNPNSR